MMKHYTSPDDGRLGQKGIWNWYRVRSSRPGAVGNLLRYAQDPAENETLERELVGVRALIAALPGSPPPVPTPVEVGDWIKPGGTEPRRASVWHVGAGEPSLFVTDLEGDGASVRKSPWPFIASTCALVAELHALGIVHLGLDPFAVVTVAHRAVCLVQLESARVAASAEAPRPHAGEEAYQPPEATASLDARSDVFSLGCLALSALLGRRLEPNSVDFVAVKRAGSMKERVAALTKHAGKHSSLRLRLVARCLANDPAERFQDAQEMAVLLAGLHAATGDAGRHTLGESLSAGGRWTREQVKAVALNLCDSFIVGDDYVTTFAVWEDGTRLALELDPARVEARLFGPEERTTWGAAALGQDKGGPTPSGRVFAVAAVVASMLTGARPTVGADALRNELNKYEGNVRREVLDALVAALDEAGRRPRALDVLRKELDVDWAPEVRVEAPKEPVKAPEVPVVTAPVTAAPKPAEKKMRWPTYVVIAAIGAVSVLLIHKLICVYGKCGNEQPNDAGIPDEQQHSSSTQCGQGETPCDGGCVNTNNDTFHCGECGKRCSNSEVRINDTIYYQVCNMGQCEDRQRQR